MSSIQSLLFQGPVMRLGNQAELVRAAAPGQEFSTFLVEISVHPVSASQGQTVDGG